ncbi:tyrosine-type recombinase/integrase [Bifidobacterium asteroides]|uniref:tyrosine-type recombinase/integrase n=1 Tax=Bifidobacterium asteroides TaxID=1684 RepID=UPI001C6A2D6F|nr:tyrosine-type recombinase/integrase [Bifidobacterium asteroides]
MCSDTAYALVKKGTGWPPHFFRRRFDTDLWEATGDVVKVQSLLGHESLATT